MKVLIKDGSNGLTAFVKRSDQHGWTGRSDGLRGVFIQCEPALKVIIIHPQSAGMFAGNIQSGQNACYLFQ